ncbi:hypothetical protein SAMN05660479_00100 [Microbulbifer thermotolerans]|uniref:hypothetical protein n=1 Tax=Microbulbifer thermotolerans TaxID=252514 RepID=UPI0008E071E6|nr:hypothetical protein [Microbulbifer thermotolerans]SFB67528.1 hypothetical protein SAMN05660479_00100 [Microbulbifer thermotolerans]
MSDRVVETLFENRDEIKKNITNVGGLCKDKDQLDLKKIAIGSLSDKNDFTYLMYFSDVNSKNSNYKCVAAVDIDGGSEVSIVGVEVLID